MRVLVLYTLPPSSKLAGRSADEFDLSEAAHGLAEVLPGARVAAVRGEASEVLSLVQGARPDGSRGPRGCAARVARCALHGLRQRDARSVPQKGPRQLRYRRRRRERA